MKSLQVAILLFNVEKQCTLKGGKSVEFSFVRQGNLCTFTPKKVESCRQEIEIPKIPKRRTDKETIVNSLFSPFTRHFCYCIICSLLCQKVKDNVVRETGMNVYALFITIQSLFHSPHTCVIVFTYLVYHLSAFEVEYQFQNRLIFVIYTRQI